MGRHPKKPEELKQDESKSRQYVSAKAPDNVMAGGNEWEHRQRNGLVNKRCACGKPARVGYICDDCRRDDD